MSELPNKFPKGPRRLLRAFCDPELLEDVEGDLNELFQRRLNEHNSKARLAAWTDVIILFRPGIIRDMPIIENSNTISMIKNYWKAAWRNMLKNKSFSTINLMSLAIGIAACMVIYLFIQDEKSFDAFHVKKENLYRLCEVQSFPGTNTQKVALTMPGMGPTMKSEFPEVLNYSRFWTFNEQLVEVGEKKVMADKMVGVDSSFFKLFDFPIIHGQKDNLIDALTDAVITETLAMKLFGKVDVIGEFFEVDEDKWRINGVIADIPENSHLQFDLAVWTYSIKDDIKSFDNEFRGNYMNTYLLIDQFADIPKLESAFEEYLPRVSGREDINEMYSLFLQPLLAVHLSSSSVEHDYNNYRKFNGEYLNVFILIGILILIIAAVNFTNLTTARAANRAKEVGVRKSIGAFKNQLVYQFMFESVMLAFISLVLAVILALLFLPFLNQLIDRQLSLFEFLSPALIGIVFSVVFLLGLIAGIYPSFYLSSFKPAVVLKGINVYERKSYLRSALVVVQFSLALAMIVSTLVVTQQLMFIKNKDIGFNKDQIMLIKMNDEASDKYDQLKTALLSESNVIGVAGSGQRLGNNFHQWGFKAKVDSGIINITPSNVLVDYDYLDVYGIKLVAGRNFSKDYAEDDGLSFIINEAFAKELGFENPIGQKVGHGYYPNDSLGTIIGVTEDFHFNSLHHKVNTLSMVIHSSWTYNELSVKINGTNTAQSIADVERVYNQFVSKYPLRYEFLDDHISELYKADDQMGSVVSIMAVLSIFIGCMGLFGLASIAIKRRIKEIGIRKVMGASMQQLMILLSKSFAMMILVAFLLATPMTYLFLTGWLDNFAYRVAINPLVFLVGVVLALVIAMLTISFHVIKAASSNPVKSLKYE
jgi:putative ABC transport system permease protein